MPNLSRRARVILFTAVLVGVVIAAVITLTGHVEKAPTANTLTIPVDGLDPGATDDRTIEVPKAVVAQAAPKLEDDLRDIPPATPQKQITQLAKAEAQNRRTTTALPTAGATAGFQGCRTSFVNNQSSRRGVRPTQMWDHLTVSPNRPGWSDVNAIVALFNRASSQASSHFVIDSEGHCAYVVPIERKAWTQAGANGFAVSFEIINTGREPVYLAPAGMRKLAMVQKEVSRRTGIPLRRGAVRNCTPTRSGIVEHRDGGICAGSHVDILRFSIDAVVKQTIALAGAGPCNRACDLTRRHQQVHADLKRIGCKPQSAASGGRCLTLHRRHQAIHRAAKKAGVKL